MSVSGYVEDELTSGDSPRPSRSGRVASVLAAILLLCSGCLGGPGPQPDETDPSVTTASTTAAAPPTKPGESLDAALAGYLDAENRSAYADEHGLRTRNGRVEVVVELEAGAVLPATVDREVVASHGNLVQARVPPGDLADLAAHENVTAVRAPNRPATDAELGGSE